MGFVDTVSADGDVAALVELCRQRLIPELGPVLYVRGRDVAADLAGDLAQCGLKVDESVVYAGDPATALRGPIEAGLREASIGGVMLFSPRSASIFVSLVRQAGLETACAGLTVLALSPAVAAAAEGPLWRNRLVAPQPKGPAMLEILEQWRDGKIGA